MKKILILVLVIFTLIVPQTVIADEEKYPEPHDDTPVGGE